MGHDVLLTGGAGFIGSSLACALLDEGHSVTVIDNLDPYYDVRLKERNLKVIGEHGDFHFIRGDILDRKLLDGAIQKNNINLIYHEAAQAGVHVSMKDPYKTNRTNVEGTLNLLVAAKDNNVHRFINASSSSVYGNVEYLPFDEEHPLRPISPYGVSKKTAEDYCRVFHSLFGLNVVTLRYFTVYGPRLRPDMAVSIFTHRALRNEKIEIFGTGENTRDFTYIDDILKANIMFADKGLSGTYNIGFGSGISINELAEKIIGLTDSASEIFHSDSQPGDVEHTLASGDLLKNELGWQPTTTIDDGLQKYIDYTRSNPDY